MKSVAFSRHTEWLSLVEVSGSFLAVPVLERIFPQGLEAIDTPKRQKLRAAYEEWREAVDEGDTLLNELHKEWIRFVLVETLEYDNESLTHTADWRGESPSISPNDGTGKFQPDWIVHSPGDEKPRVFISVFPPDTDLESVRLNDGWPVSLQERMALLCRAHEVRVGVLTDGERWMIVSAPVGSTSGHASWYARLWFQEPTTLKAFQSLLGVRRRFGPTSDTLEALLEESLEHNETVTDTLGEQVRRAVEVLVQCLDKADEDRNRELLRDVSPSELYEAGLTVMMRLVFVLCAEERGLLLLGESVYDECYAVSTLRGQLAEDADRHGPEILERRHDAWARLLAVFRAIFRGIDHENMRLPALGGSLFDPDRFPFLEGRGKGTTWRDTVAAPLPIDNRTVLLLLNSLQVLEQAGGALLLSYRALDVEQIGHVYEGLLEHTVKRVSDVTLGLRGSKDAKTPNIALAKLESAGLDGEIELRGLIKEITRRSEAAIKRDLSNPADPDVVARISSVCGGKAEIVERIRPFANLLRLDAWGDPIVYRAKSFMVTLGTDRRETGTHYTPKSLTESMVCTTLEPLVYEGPSEGSPRERWKLKSPSEILDLKICDPAMGSGAFLVQTCRYLAEKLVESWRNEERTGKSVNAEGEVVGVLGSAEPMSPQVDERLRIARHLIAERCLYGVDINPLAVELAKLSIWLVTLANGRPFGFLDHHLRCGDSLLGLHRMEQLTRLSMNAEEKNYQLRFFDVNVRKSIGDALTLRKRLNATKILDIHDVEAMANFNREAKKKLETVEMAADAMIAASLQYTGRQLENALDALSEMADEYVSGKEEAKKQVSELTRSGLSVDLRDGENARRPFHWVMEFPEVFNRVRPGFDAFVGNPPFLGGQRITGILGTAYRDWLVKYIAEGRRGSADLVAYFYLRTWRLLREGGNFGLLAVNTIAEGDTRQVGLESMVKDGAVIYAAFPNEPWPGNAAVVTSRVHVHKGEWNGAKVLSGQKMPHISAFLSGQREWSPKRLKANANIAFQGSIVLGMGFVLTYEEAQRMLDSDAKNADVIFPYLNGEDLNSDPRQRPSRYVINFWDWPEERAEEYTLPYEWVLRNVKPERLQNNDRGAREKWWRFLRARSELYHTIGRGHHFMKHPKGWKATHKPLENVIVIALASKTLAFAYLSSSMVFSHATAVFALENMSYLAVLQSSIHGTYAWQNGSTLKNDLRYTPSDVFETFPLPEERHFEDSSHLLGLGVSLHKQRATIMTQENIGLTPLYKRIHDPNDNDARIEELRELSREIDLAISNAYGWNDLDLEHDFHKVSYLPENDRLRFTISESARVEVLRRLSELNRLRYNEEVEKGLQGRKRIKMGSLGEVGQYLD